MLQRQLIRISSGHIFQTSRLRGITVILNNDKLEPKAFFRTCKYISAGYKIENNLKDCYNLLNVKDGCSEEELKEAYIRLAKLYHPDSKSKTADPKKFSQVKEAYKAIKRKIETDRDLQILDDEEDDYETLLKWRAPQHRQYLSHEGIGSGTMSERQKQYEQLRVTQATDRVNKYKLKKLVPEEDNALVAKDKRLARTRKIREDVYLRLQIKNNTVDRMVEDMILESMSKGSFDNLSGAGKPHKFSDRDKNPYVDKVTAKLNQILIDDDMKPEWISMQKEIRDDIKKARERLAVQRRLLGDPPHSEAGLKRWKLSKENFRASIVDINERINNFNLIVPILNKQMVHYDCDKEMENINADCDKFIPQNYDFSHHIVGIYHEHLNQQPGVSWKFKDIWKSLKDVLKS